MTVLNASLLLRRLPQFLFLMSVRFVVDAVAWLQNRLRFAVGLLRSLRETSSRLIVQFADVLLDLSDVLFVRIGVHVVPAGSPPLVVLLSFLAIHLWSLLVSECSLKLFQVVFSAFHLEIFIIFVPVFDVSLGNPGGRPRKRSLLIIQNKVYPRLRVAINLIRSWVLDQLGQTEIAADSLESSSFFSALFFFATEFSLGCLQIGLGKFKVRTAVFDWSCEWVDAILKVDDLRMKLQYKHFGRISIEVNLVIVLQDADESTIRSMK